MHVGKAALTLALPEHARCPKYLRGTAKFYSVKLPRQSVPK
jgi:hypothetical protein